ncbi:hypothetical protein H5410_001915 [Solanum commersonii]|uniref:Uncharacterized protein n=1 Tax=Solanum commersonii TaxID=4109 RepID=A0A9J6B0E0_SOLCO|nr:hypothetical protein H5410_001915 [Solanum commersonii]
MNLNRSPQSYENELSEHLMGPSIREDDGEVTLVRVEYEKSLKMSLKKSLKMSAKEECEGSTKMSMKAITKMSLKASLKMTHHEF